MNRLKQLSLFLLFSIFILWSCEKDTDHRDKDYNYYEVGFKSDETNWRDTAFVVRTSDSSLIRQIESQLALPVTERKLVVGALVKGSGGYNKNASHEFKWHFKEDDWNLADMTVEIYDGKPYTDVDLHLSYWVDTVKRFGSWSSYIRKKLPNKPD